MIFERHPEVRSYDQSVAFAVKQRTDRDVTGIEIESRETRVTLDAKPTDGEFEEIDDILEATERYRQAVDGQTLVYQLQQVDPDDPDLPDRHLMLDERISELVGDAGKIGKNAGGVAPANVTPDTAGQYVTVELPENASDEARERVEQAMLAFGKRRI